MFGLKHVFTSLYFVEPTLSEWQEVKGCTSLCDSSETSTWVRYCVDPSKNVQVSASYCNLDSYPEEQRQCGRKMAQCPGKKKTTV